MLHINIENDFINWRLAARKLLHANVAPDEILWSSGAESELFQSDKIPESAKQNLVVPKEFLEVARMAACFDSMDKWAGLYRVLFRLVHETRNLLEIESDPDVRQILLMRKAVKRDIHKFHAFVRFRTIESEDGEIYVAWHEPHHNTVELSVPFFVRRFGSMRWSILTPRGCAHWDLKDLTFSPAVSKDQAPKDDITEDFWLTYYKSIFNPFRLKVKMMKKEMPVRHWHTLPEAQLIPELIRKGRELTPALKEENTREIS
jgi:DNA polymerase